MHLRFDQNQTRRLLAWAGHHARAEVEAGCEPAGYTLVIDVAGPFGCAAHAEKGSSSLELGDIMLDITESA
ncbi:hypothetical protein ACQQ2N_04245 [Dokdonella sp. MW10]|uniref:hypothetical protein n=1 Tax=Dokdonella sp. MW10 TaxID=2992926 RepID=UPI003F7D24EC